MGYTTGEPGLDIRWWQSNFPSSSIWSNSGGQPAVHQMGVRDSFGWRGVGVRRQELHANQSLFSSTAIRRPRPTVGCDADALPCYLPVTTSDFSHREERNNRRPLPNCGLQFLSHLAYPVVKTALHKSHFSDSRIPKPYCFIKIGRNIQYVQSHAINIKKERIWAAKGVRGC